VSIMTRTDWDTPVKQRIRAEQLALPYKVDAMLTLPGPECLDIQHLLRTGRIDSATSGVAVEHFGMHIPHIRRRLADMRLTRWDVRCMELERLELGGPGSLQFAYLDMCTALTSPLCVWMQRELSRAMRIGGHVSVTFLRQFRRNRLMAHVRDSSLFRGTNFRTGTLDMIRDVYDGEVTQICATLAALTRLSLPTCVLSLRYAEPYTSDSGAYMFAARFEVVDKQPRTVDKVLLERLALVTGNRTM